MRRPASSGATSCSGASRRASSGLRGPTRRSWQTRFASSRRIPAMTGYLARRLLLIVPTLLGAVTLVFIAIRLTPGDPVQVLLGDFGTPQAVAELRQQYGLD